MTRLSSPRNNMKMICPNKNCINKSTVYRKNNGLRDNNCKLCNSPLIVDSGRLAKKQDIKAKQELKELESHNVHQVYQI